MAVTAKQIRDSKREKAVLKLVSEYEAKGLKKTQAVLLIAEKLNYTERYIYQIIKKASENGESKSE